MSNINIRIDGDIKSSAEKVFARLGLTPTTAIVLFYNQVIRTNSIPFELKADMPNEKTVKALQELEEMENNTDRYESYSSVAELMEDLLK